MDRPISFHLEPVDENDPAAGYRAVVEPTGIIGREELAEAMVEEGLPTDANTVLGLIEAEQAAIASLMWEGWDVATPEGVLETPWPDPARAALLGGTTSGRPTASREQLARRMLKHGIPHTRSHVEAFFTAQRQVSLRLMRDGYEIKHPIGDMRLTIEGAFDGPDDDHDPERHTLNIEIDDQSEITDWLEGYREMKRRELSGPPRPLLDRYEDVNTSLWNDYVCPGHMIRLCGHWLRFRRSDPRQGVFFVAEDGATQRQEAVALVLLHEAVFIVPRDLPPGPYWLEVRAVLLPRDGLQRGTLPEPVLVKIEDEPDVRNN